MNKIRIFLRALLSLIVLISFTNFKTIDNPIYYVSDYGAVGDGKTMDTEAIYKALNACSLAGGGTVYFSAGTFLTGPLHIKNDNITIEISAGAVILASDNFEDYPIVYTRWEGVDCYAYSPVIFADSVKNFTLTGRGTINGNGQKWWDYHFELQKKYNAKGNELSDFSAIKAQGPKAEELARLNADTGRDPADQYGWMAQTQFLRPPLVQFYKCQNVLLEKLTLINSPFWTVHPLYSDNVNIDKITIDNITQAGGDSPNTDGIDPESSTNVRISNSHINVGDDCIAIKSGRDEAGRKAGRPTENLTIVNCTMVNGHAGVVIGSEMSGGVRNVTVSNCIFQNTDRGIRIKTMRGRGGTVENIRYQNLIIENTRLEAIMINMNYHATPEEEISERTPHIKDVYISNITIRNAAKILKIEGLKESPVRGVYMNNIVADGKSGLQIDFADNVNITSCIFKNTVGDLFNIKNSKNINLNQKEVEGH